MTYTDLASVPLLYFTVIKARPLLSIALVSTFIRETLCYFSIVLIRKRHKHPNRTYLLPHINISEPCHRYPHFLLVLCFNATYA